MALGNSTSSGFNSGPLIFLNPRTKDKDGKKAAPHFTADRPGPDGKALVRDEQTYTEISGDLFRAEVKPRTFKNPKTGKDQTVTDWPFYMRDAEASYRLGLSQNSTSRDLINRFATLLDTGDFTDLTIKYYENKKGRDAFYMTQRGEKVPWKYDLADLPKPYEIRDPRTNDLIKRDYTEVDEFFNQIVLQIAEKLKGAKTTSPAPAPASAPAAAEQEAPATPPAPAQKVAAPTKPAAGATRPAANPAPKPVARATPAPAQTPTRPAVAQQVQRPAAKPTPAPVPAETENPDDSIPF